MHAELVVQCAPAAIAVTLVRFTGGEGLIVLITATRSRGLQIERDFIGVIVDNLDGCLSAGRRVP